MDLERLEKIDKLKTKMLKYIFYKRRTEKEIIDKIYNICEKEMSFEEILKYIFDEYNLTMNANQYVLVGSTIKSYLSYLLDENKLSYEFKDNKMLWKQNI